MFYEKRNRSVYEELVKTTADTRLFEMAIDTLVKVEYNKQHPNDDCHWRNSIIYSEFWRRGKAFAYKMAFDKVNKEYKKDLKRKG